jgi:hypothetical protein
MAPAPRPPQQESIFLAEALAPIERTIFFGTPQRVLFHIVIDEEEDLILAYRDTYYANVSQARRDIGEGRARLAFALLARDGAPIGEPLTAASTLEEIDQRVHMLRLPLPLMDILSDEYVIACGIPQATARRLAASLDFGNGPAENGALSGAPATSQDAP